MFAALWWISLKRVTYERYNGILEQQPTNNWSIEIQLMRRFIHGNNAYTILPPPLYRDELQSLVCFQHTLTGSLLMTAENMDHELPTLCTRHVFETCEMQILKELMMKLSVLPTEDDRVTLNSLYYKYRECSIKGKKFLSTTSKCKSIVMAL